MKQLSFVVLVACAPLAMAQAPVCSARSGDTVTPVIELYTSEGCSSCPPADRWLSTLQPGAPNVALAFHVDYWDRLGWRDRFASPAFSRRQQAQRAVNGARVSYTPQVVVQGVDLPDWRGIRLPVSNSAKAQVDITISGDGGRFDAIVQARPGAPARLAAFWAVSEDGHLSRVTAGENAGEKLAHDHVVRELHDVPPWMAATIRLQFAPALALDAAHPRALSLVVIDAATGRPLQALRLRC
ncbi:thioredoxin family protein [uncultured Piscinibacter sp.]|uniref:DUF1223 domain-containing protein n=1 Tax=uncultured Piscinibacter sp. TaxID=1131835 RepID=UPI00260BB77C|nr:DUF1223 domain-containing protein [uncultured Piscinibacter sp.]